MPSERSLKVLHTPWLVLSVSVPYSSLSDIVRPADRPNILDIAIRSEPFPGFTLQTIVSIVALAISGSLVGYYNSNGYPAINGQYKPRIRIILVASVWMSVFSSESREREDGPLGLPNGI